MYRILLDPEPIDEGSPVVEEMIQISSTELKALRDAIAKAAMDAEAGSRAAVRAAERNQADDHLRDEEITRATRKAEDWERAFKAATREKELASALAGRSLVQGAAPQLIKLWRDELEVIDEGGTLKVVSRDGRPVIEAVNSWLTSAEYAHFSRPSSRGGTTPPGDSRSTAMPPSAPSPKNLGEAVLMRWRDAIHASRQDPGAAIGLGRRRH